MKLIANRTLPLQAQAFLMALYVGESGGDYGILYGGGHFDAATPSLPGHYGFPQWAGKDNSHAAGAPQFEPETWLAVCMKHAISLNFRSPEDQDTGAWLLAQDDYHSRTGGSLLNILQTGAIAGTATALHSTWTSLSESTFPGRYAAALAMLAASAPPTVPQPSPAPTAPQAPQKGNPMSSILQQLKQWPPTTSTVIGLGVLLGLGSYAWTGSFEGAVAIAGAFKLLCPEAAPALQQGLDLDQKIAQGVKA